MLRIEPRGSRTVELRCWPWLSRSVFMVTIPLLGQAGSGNARWDSQTHSPVPAVVGLAPSGLVPLPPPGFGRLPLPLVPPPLSGKKESWRSDPSACCVSCVLLARPHPRIHSPPAPRSCARGDECWGLQPGPGGGAPRCGSGGWPAAALGLGCDLMTSWTQPTMSTVYWHRHQHTGTLPSSRGIN